MVLTTKTHILQQKKWCIIDSEANGNYSKDHPIKLLLSSLESNLCDYSDAYVLVTGNTTVTRTIASNPVQRKQVLDTWCSYTNSI